MKESINIFNKKMNKGGGEKILSLWWFFILGVIGGFIVMGITIFYSADTNVNPIEASILMDKLSGCLVNNGDLNLVVFNESFDILNRCNLDKKMFGMGSFVYFNVSIYNNEGFVKEFVNGSGIFEADCKIADNIFGENFPSCVSRNFFSSNGNNYRVFILVGSNQIGGKISLKE